MRLLPILLLATLLGDAAAHAGRSQKPPSAGTALWRNVQDRYGMPVDKPIDRVSRKQLRRMDGMIRIGLELLDVKGEQSGLVRTVGYKPGDKLAGAPTAISKKGGVTVSRRVNDAGQTEIETAFTAGARIPKLMRGMKDAWKVRPGYEVRYTEVVGSGKVEVEVWRPNDNTRPLVRAVVDRK